MKPVKIAVIGHAHDHAAQTLSTLCELPEFDVVGVADVPAEIWPHMPHYTVEEMLSLPQLEAVAIEAAEEDATALAIRFANRGVAVHLDKPGSPDLAAFSELIGTVKKKDLPFHMGYMYRYNPVVQDMFRRIEAGELGEIFSVEAQMSVHHTEEKRAWLSKYPGGMTYFLGCHLIDLVLRIMGEPQKVIPMNGKTRFEDIDAVDYGFVVFQYARGISFIKTCAREVNGFARRQLVVCGSRGTYELKPFEENISLFPHAIHTPYSLTLSKSDTSPWFDAAMHLDSAPFGRYTAMMQDFAAIVRGKENPYTPDYELRLFRLLMQCCGHA